jgi:hypothetical protein
MQCLLRADAMVFGGIMTQTPPGPESECAGGLGRYLIGIVVAGGVIAGHQKLSIWKHQPTNTVAEIGVVINLECIGVSRGSPDIDAHLFAQFYGLCNIIVENLIHNGIHDDILLRSQHEGASQSMFWWLQYDRIWQWMRKNSSFGAVGHIMRRGLTGIDEYRFNFEFQPLVFFLIDALINQDSQIGPHLDGGALADGGDAILSGLGAYGDALSNASMAVAARTASLIEARISED